MTIQSEGEVKAEVKSLWRRVEELEAAVLELATKVRTLESVRPVLGLKKEGFSKIPDNSHP